MENKQPPKELSLAPSIEIIELNVNLIPEASKLLASFIQSNRWDNLLLQECNVILMNLISSNIAHFYLARNGNELVGFVSIHWGFSTTKGKPILRIQDLYTTPEYRGNGIAKALIDFCEELAYDRGANSIRLETDTENTNARNLYEKQGFEWFPRKEVYMKFMK